MKFGFCIPHDGELSRPDNLARLSVHAEKLGFDTLVEPSDHIAVPHAIKTTYPYSVSGEYIDTREDLDQAVALSFVAAKTEKVRLMTGITVVPYRSPLAHSKSLATVDYLSNGRLDVGVGVGWLKEEFEILNVPFEERGEIMDEYLKIMKAIWSNSRDPTFEGKYFRFSNALFSPEVVQKPHPPIWVGGESPRAMRRAAELGDGWLPIGSNPRFPLSNAKEMKRGISQFKKELEKSRRRVENIGYLSQDFELDKNTSKKGTFVGDARKIISDIREFESLGVTFLAFNFIHENNLEKTKEYAQKFAEEVISNL